MVSFAESGGVPRPGTGAHAVETGDGKDVLKTNNNNNNNKDSNSNSSSGGQSIGNTGTIGGGGGGNNQCMQRNL